MKKAEYVKKYGTEAYIRKAYRPKYRVAALRKVKKIVPKPVSVGKQPKGLARFAEDVRHCRTKYDESYTKAKERTYESEYWERRRRYAKYSPKVQRYIRDMYAEAKVENRLKKVRGPDGSFVSTESEI